MLIAAHGNSLRALVKMLDKNLRRGDHRLQHPDRRPARLRARRRPDAEIARISWAIPKLLRKQRPPSRRRARPSDLPRSATASRSSRAADIFIADNADVIGSVRLLDRVSVWFNCVLRGDNDWIEIGERSNVQDGCVLHTDPGYELTVGDDVDDRPQGHAARLPIGEQQR